MANWREMIRSEINGIEGEDVKLVACTLSDEDFDRNFDDGYGGPEGSAFTAWTENRVYFPVCYDGAEFVGSAPRNPCDEATDHQGGW